MKSVRSIGLIFTWTISLLCFLPFTSSAGSPFYLTVERGFSINENPQIRLDYSTSSQPLLLRVLRPKNLTLFLDGQLNISRSYEKPLSELNPGHFFAKGLNKAESPLKVFRDMLDADFRKSLKETPLHKAIVDPGQSEWVSTPTQIIQGSSRRV